ncbi:MAG: prohead protease/major capsid protein fusion protein, partial [Silanimonas sp.]
GKDHWFTAEEAKAAGFVDEIVSATPVAAMASFDLSKFRDVPAAVQARLVSAKPAHDARPGAAASNPMESSMTTPATQEQIEAARAEGARAEVERRNGIAAAFKPFASHEGMPELQAALIADATVTVEAANQRILAKLAEGAKPAAGGYVVRTVEDERDKIVAAGVNALHARAGILGRDGKRVAMEQGNPFRGSTLLDMAKASLARAGFKTEGMDKMQIVGAAFTQSTSDFPILLENTMHKAMQAAYAVAPYTWNRFCKQGSVSDFRPHKRYRVGSLSNLQKVNELGEFVNKTIPDGERSTIAVDTKGNIINLSRQAIINDDLAAFVGLAAALGTAARRTVEADVYAALALNGGLGPVLDDGNPLFHARTPIGNNIGTAAALSTASIDADRVLMGSQRDVGGNDFLDLRPSILLVPLALEGLAKEINAQEYNDESNKQQRRPNSVRGLYNDVIGTPRLTGTRRYSFADPSVAPAMEVAFLDGNDEPFLDMEQGFTVDGSAWKVRLDFGVAGIDYRGAVTNAGA